MSLSAIGAQSALAIQQLVKMRNQFDDLQRQLSTGRKSDTYAGLGLDRGVTVSLNAQLSALAGYDSTIDNVMTRIDLMSTVLGRMTDIGSAVKAAMAQATTTAGNSSPGAAQQTAQMSLDELLGLLNTQAGNRYLFSGRATDQPAVVTLDQLLDGDGSRAGLKQLIDERTQADLGASGLGRLAISTPTATSVSVAEDSATSPFGFKLASISASLTNGSVSGPSGSPAAVTVDLTGLPSEGDTVTLRLTLPDGTSENLTLTATGDSPAGDNQFTIGATAAATAANLQSALNTSIGTLADTALAAASAVAASDDFFDADAANPPQRVDGPPFDTATAMIAGSSADTVIWYTGETGTDPARGTATARIDESLSVSYGARANESGIRNLVQSVATLAAVTLSAGDPNDVELGKALNRRLSGNLSSSGIPALAADLATAQASLDSAKERHQQTGATLGDFLQQIEGVTNEEVGAKILSLQTRMQASMQTTAMLFQTSLVNYL